MRGFTDYRRDQIQIIRIKNMQTRLLWDAVFDPMLAGPKVERVPKRLIGDLRGRSDNPHQNRPKPLRVPNPEFRGRVWRDPNAARKWKS